MASLQDFTEDNLLDGRVLLRQPRNGYRAGIDPVFLAASINPQPGDTILDVGAGVGVASVCLAARCPDVTKIVGVEINRDAVKMAQDNIVINNFQRKIQIIQGDLLRPPPALVAGTYSHVMTNPPYFDSSSNKMSPYESKALSNLEGEADFIKWAKFCLLMVKPKGTVTFIHRAERLDMALSFLTGKLGSISIYPLWPGKNKPAKIVLIRGIKNSFGALKLTPGMVLHNEDGYTDEAEKILRHANGLNW